MPAEDAQELRHLVCLLRRARAGVGHVPLADTVRCLLHDSGLAGWLQQEQQRLEEASRRGAAPTPCADADASLPLGLQTVLQKAARLQDEVEEAAAAKAGIWGGGGGLLWQSSAAALEQQQGASQQEERALELLSELLAQVAMEATSDSMAGGGSSSSSSSSLHGSTGSGSSHPTGGGWMEDDDAPLPQQQQQQQQQQRNPGALTISTIHASKGLEWPVLLLPYVVDGALPLAFHGPRMQPGGAACDDPDVAVEIAKAAQAAAQASAITVAQAGGTGATRWPGLHVTCTHVHALPQQPCLTVGRLRVHACRSTMLRSGGCSTWPPRAHATACWCRTASPCGMQRGRARRRRAQVGGRTLLASHRPQPGRLGARFSQWHTGRRSSAARCMLPTTSQPWQDARESCKVRHPSGMHTNTNPRSSLSLPLAERWQSQAEPQALSQLERARHELAQQPCCSSTLAATLRRLRGAPAAAQPAAPLLRFDGRLPEEDFPGA